MVENNIRTSVTTTIITKYSFWEEYWEDCRALELTVAFCNRTILNNLSDDEICSILFQSKFGYVLHDIAIIRPEKGGLHIIGSILDKDYYDDPFVPLEAFKQWILNGITLYMMTNVEDVVIK